MLAVYVPLRGGAILTSYLPKRPVTYEETLQNALIGIDEIILTMKSFINSYNEAPLNNYEDVYELILDLLLEEIRLINTLLKDFNPCCFICEEVRLIWQLERSISFLETAYGTYQYSCVFGDTPLDYCTFLSVFPQSLYEMLIILTYLENTQKQFICPCE